MNKVALLALCAFAAAAQTAEPGLEANVEGERRKDPAATGLRASEARDLAGTHGDPVVAAQMLPGVAREPIGSGQLVVWGAAPGETRLLLDGIEVPALYHGGGLRSVVPAEMVRRIELSPAAFGAQWGRALGGVLDVEMAAPSASRVAVDPLDAHAAVAVPLGDSRISFGARYSLLDRILGSSLSDTAREVFPLPRYWDGQLVADVPLRPGEKLELLLFGASDSAERDVGDDPGTARGDSAVLRWGRLGLRYESAGATVVAWIGDELQQDGTFNGPASSSQTRWARSLGLRAAYRMPLFDGGELTLGIDGLFTRTRMLRFGSLTTPAREGDVTAFGQPPGIDVAADGWTVDEGELAPFAAASFEAGPFVFTPGIRLSGVATDTSQLTPRLPLAAPLGLSQLEWLPEPRLQIAFRATDRLGIFAAGGVHHQAPAPEDLSSVFGTASLTSSSALHFTAGASYRLFEQLSLTATGYLRLLDGLATRSPLPTPQLAQALVQQGTGRSYGAQLVARSQGRGPWSGFVSALLSRSERQDLPSGRTRLFDFDQPLAFTAAGSYRWGENTFGGRLRYASGFPRTPVVGAFLDASQGREEPVFGAQNSDRLPAFFALDLSAARNFDLGGGRTLRVYLEIENATAQENAEELVYSSGWSSRGTLRGLPPLALLGAELVL